MSTFVHHKDTKFSVQKLLQPCKKSTEKKIEKLFSFTVKDEIKKLIKARNTTSTFH